MPSTTPVTRGATFVGIALTVAIVDLALTTAYIHLSLGGPLFTLNAAGYAALAAAYAVCLVPHPVVHRFGWLPRLGLAGYAATTILAYLVMGPYFSLGWVAKAIEVALIALVVGDLVRVYGSPARVAQAARDTLRGARPASPA